MQTTTLNPSTAPHIRYRGASSGSTAELWKDFRQVRQPVSAILVALLALQAILLLCAFLLESELARANCLALLITIALLSPVLVIIACAGMLIGHERQTGTWGWNSALPHSWKQSLFSKLVVTVTTSLAVPLALSILPAIAYFSSGIAANDQWQPALILVASVFVVDCLAFYFLSLLLFRDSLNGLLVATGALILMQVLTLSTPLLIKELFHEQPVDTNATWQIVSVLTSGGMIALLGLLAMVATFRWRWGTGQMATFQLPANRSISVAPVQPLIRDNLSPGEMPMLMHLSWRNYLILRISLATALAALALFGHWLIVVWTGFACLLFGLTAFAGDQTRTRFRFIADRGVSPNRLVTSRLAVPFAFVALCAVLVLSGSLANYRVSLLFEWFNLTVGTAAVGMAVVLFLFGALASLCFDKPVISFTVAISIAGTITTLAVILSEVLWSQLDINPGWWSLYAGVLFGLIAIPLFAWSIYSFAQGWLIEDRPMLGRRFVSTILVATAFPALIPICFGFLAIPKVPWQGLSLEEAGANATVPEFEAVELLPAVPVFMGLETALRRHSGHEPDFQNMLQAINDRISGDESITALQMRAFNERLADGEDTSILALDVVRGFKQRLAELESQLESSSASTAPNNEKSIAVLRDLLLDSAAVFVYLNGIGEYSAASQALKAHHQLQEIAARDAAPETIFARVNSFKLMREQVNDWGQLGTREELSQLLSPSLFDSQQQLLSHVKRQAEAERARLRSSGSIAASRTSVYSHAVRLIPTLRWRQERQLALGLQEALELFEGKRSWTELHYLSPGGLNEYFASLELTRERAQILNELPRETAEQR